MKETLLYLNLPSSFFGEELVKKVSSEIEEFALYTRGEAPVAMGVPLGDEHGIQLIARVLLKNGQAMEIVKSLTPDHDLVEEAISLTRQVYLMVEVTMTPKEG